MKAETKASSYDRLKHKRMPFIQHEGIKSFLLQKTVAENSYRKQLMKTVIENSYKKQF